MMFRYKETRLNLEPASASSVVELKIPSLVTSHGRSSSHRNSTVDTSAGAYEQEWKAKYLATASSIYHRKHHSSPRAFLWRLLEHNTVLSIRAADISRQQKDPDASLVLHLRFYSPIRPSCIGFADPVEHDALYVFLVDNSNILYSITLRPELFRKRSASEGGLREFCKSYAPPGFGFKHPHRLVAISSEQLIVTMHDGGILKFDRNRTHDSVHGHPWRETIYNVAGWGQSLRGLVPFQRSPTVRYQKINMELTAATSTAVTSMGHDDTSFLFTICLDHRLRVWDVQTGQILYTGDILNAQRDPQEVGKWTIDPSQSNLVRIVDVSYGQALAVTFSPLGAGEFKFWKVKANDQGSILVADLFPNHQLVPRSPSSSDVWTLADFGVLNREAALELWTLWKNNTTYRVQSLQVRPNDSTGPWSDGWKGVRIENAVPYAQASGPCDSIDSSERWLNEIFFPGRFPKATLETALAIYEKGLVGPAKDDTSSKTGKSLAQSVSAVVGSIATLERNSSGEMDYERFRANSEVHWRRFYRLLGELDKQRGEALSLVVDAGIGTVWVVCTDCLAYVRQCSNLELVCHNLAAPDKSNEDVAALVQAGLTFVESFSDGMWQLCRSTLQSQLFEESTQTDVERLQFFSDKAGFWRQITDEDCANIVDNLGHNFRIVTPRLYEDLFDLIAASGDENSRELQQAFTQFGGRLIVRAIQDTAELHWQILFSQLILLVHMEFEFENEEDALHSRVDVGATYRQILAALRRLEHVKWMAKTEICLPQLKERSNSIPGSVSSPLTTKRSIANETQAITVLEPLVGHLLGLAETDSQPLLSSITEVVVNLCAPDSDIELLPHLQQCFLLKADRPDLALELRPFADQAPFSTYVQGRVFLALNDYDTAAFYFKKAAIGLSISMRNLERHSSRLLDETEWNLLNSGLPNYYSHIVNLYDRQKAFSFVIEFARLALRFASASDDETLSVRTEMLSRLFTAATAISHFDVAHSTLLMMKDEALQRSYLKRLVEIMCETGQSKVLVALPFSGLQDKVDSILLERCRATRDVRLGTPYHQILYAWRVSRNDYRGAAAILLDRLEKLRLLGEGDKLGGEEDTLDTLVTRQYLLLINALSCLDSKQAFILEDSPENNLPNNNKSGSRDAMESKKTANSDILVRNDTHLGSLKALLEQRGGGKDYWLEGLRKSVARSTPTHSGNPTRKVITLSDVRKQYQDELDRIVAIQNDQYAYSPDDEDVMDTA
ncbi:hypothetical protein VTK73DRAFT_7256 [Phialemonium thermophilum]|uniref:Uncharacterized protein n=1 Tax=Phialemonium thermophilum TaxID=223376 RepID=A0ABR3XT02_9PEZI